MIDWLIHEFEMNSLPSLGKLATRLMFALALGLCVAAIYRWNRRGVAIAATFPGTLVLLCILIAMVTAVVENNMARAFSLVGTLAIVRFRTVVQDTQDTAFVIFAVVIGMAVGADHIVVAAVGLVIVGFAATLLRPRPLRAKNDWEDTDAKLVVRIAISRPAEELLRSLNSLIARSRLIGVASARGGTVLDLTYLLRLQSGASPIQVIEQLHQIDGIQEADLRATVTS